MREAETLRPAANINQHSDLELLQGGEKYLPVVVRMTDSEQVVIFLHEFPKGDATASSEHFATKLRPQQPIAGLAIFACEALELGHHALEFSDQRAHSRGPARL